LSQSGGRAQAIGTRSTKIAPEWTYSELRRIVTRQKATEVADLYAARQHSDIIKLRELLWSRES
jgi:hypothetical protein